jgi:hypothetical protein
MVDTRVMGSGYKHDRRVYDRKTETRYPENVVRRELEAPIADRMVQDETRHTG